MINKHLRGVLGVIGFSFANENRYSLRTNET